MRNSSSVVYLESDVLFYGDDARLRAVVPDLEAELGREIGEEYEL
jgi:hypothetical protein